MLELILLRLDLVDAGYCLHLELSIQITNLGILALEVIVYFSSESFLLINPQQKTLQRVSLVSCNFLGLEFIRGIALFNLVAKCLDDHIGVFDCLLDLMDILLVLFIQLRQISLCVHQLLCQIKVIVSFVLTS